MTLTNFAGQQNFRKFLGANHSQWLCTTSYVLLTIMQPSLLNHYIYITKLVF